MASEVCEVAMLLHCACLTTLGCKGVGMCLLDCFSWCSCKESRNVPTGLFVIVFVQRKVIFLPVKPVVTAEAAASAS